MRTLLFIFSIATLAAICHHADAQHVVWAKQFAGTGDNRAWATAVDAAGNVYTAGDFEDSVDFDPGPGILNLTSAGATDVFITKLDASGNLVWAKQFGGNTFEYLYSMTVDSAGNVYTTGIFRYTVDFDPGPGTFNLTAGNFSYDAFITKFDASGNFIWAGQFGLNADSRAIAVDAVGNMYVAGTFKDSCDFDPGPGTFNLTTHGTEVDIFVTKLDATGNLVWAKVFGGFNGELANSLVADAAGNLYVTGMFLGVADFDPGTGTLNLTSEGVADVFIMKLDASGNLVWAKPFGGTAWDEGESIAVDAAGNVYATGFFEGTVDFDPGFGTFHLTSAGYEDIFVIKLDASGNLTWVKQLGGSEGTERGGFIALDTAANVYAMGVFEDTADFDPQAGIFNLISGGARDIFLVKLNTSGNLVWAEKFGGTGFDYGASIIVDARGRVYAAANFANTVDFGQGTPLFNFTSQGGTDVAVLKLTQSSPFVIQGNVFNDANAGCVNDTSDIHLRDFLVKAEPGPFYGLSNASGDYTIYLFDTGSYTISMATKDTIWQPICTTAYNLQLSGTPDTTTGIDFALQAAYYCTRLSVELGVVRLRRCNSNNKYTFTYLNTGTLAAFNAYIEVDFGDYLQPQSSQIPWTTATGNVYTFPIGNLDMNQQGSFTVTTYLDCAAQFGSTQCVTAHIYPDSLCIPPPAGWDSSAADLAGACLNDSLVCFTLKNIGAAGSGDMVIPAAWELFANDTLVARGTYLLAGQDSLVKCYPANGKTYRFEADQTPPHPRHGHHTIVVEACGNAAPSFGFVNTASQNDDDLFIETFCMEVTGSFDPNDKQVFPAGITSNRYITADDELEYMIRFQNTGNDTAFKVVIVDTIATDVLDITTLVSGASSHDYTFNIYGAGIAEWTFDNILLPDSFVNEPGSHGFVKFKIKQLPGNTDGTRIENRSAIYFDFNEPVITNTAWNEVNETNMPVSLLSAAIDSVTLTCYGDSNGTATISATGGLAPYQYEWSNGVTTSFVSHLPAGDHSVTVTDGAGTALTDSVSMQAQQVNTGIILGTDSANINLNATYSVNSGLSYTWNVTNGAIVSGQGTNTIEVDWSTTGQATIQVIATDQGCSDTVSKSITLLDPTGIEDALLSALDLYPNPTNGTITLKAANIQAPASLKLYDSIGKELLQQNATPAQFQQGIMLDLNGVKEGVLFLHIKTGSGTRVMKVVKY